MRDLSLLAAALLAGCSSAVARDLNNTLAAVSSPVPHLTVRGDADGVSAGAEWEAAVALACDPGLAAGCPDQVHGMLALHPGSGDVIARAGYRRRLYPAEPRGLDLATRQLSITAGGGVFGGTVGLGPRLEARAYWGIPETESGLFFGLAGELDVLDLAPAAEAAAGFSIAFY